MNIRFNKIIILLLLAVAWPVQFCLGWWWQDDGELDRLVMLGMKANPRLRKHWQVIEQMQAERDAVGGFWDPLWSARTGHSQARDGEDRGWVGAGIAAPVRRVGYLDLNLEQGYAESASDAGGERLHQTTGRLGWRVPLWRDRGFREWHIRDEQARAHYGAAGARWVAEAQALRRNISLAYLTLLERRAVLDVAVSALERAEILQAEAEALAELAAIPAYQVSAASLEVALRREEQLAARQSVETQEWRLRELLGTTDDLSLELRGDPAQLVEWAIQAPVIDSIPPTLNALRRGDLRENAALRESARYGHDLAMEHQRANLDFELSFAHQGEDPDRWFAGSAWRHERAASVEAVVAWSRPWGYVAERADAARYQAVLTGLEDESNALELENRVRLHIAVRQFQVIGQRLQLAAAAVASAESALQAESDRFRLGEGRSRDVLDAQKDLTDTMRRQIIMATELLRSSVDIHYSLGFEQSIELLGGRQRDFLQGIERNLP